MRFRQITQYDRAEHTFQLPAPTPVHLHSSKQTPRNPERLSNRFTLSTNHFTILLYRMTIQVKFLRPVDMNVGKVADA